MIEVTDAALNQLKGYFQDKDPSPIRVYLAAGG